MNQLSIAEIFAQNTTPDLFWAPAFLFSWYLICKIISKEWTFGYTKKDEMPVDKIGITLDAQLANAYKERMLASRGSKFDRLFFTGLASMAGGTLLWVGLWTVGVVPASTQERAFIEDLRASPFSSRPQVAAAIAAADGSTYISRLHYFAAEKAFLLSSK